VKWIRRIPYIEWIPIVFIGIVFYKLIDQFPATAKVLHRFYELLIPLIWAAAIAYLLNPALNFMEQRMKMGRKRSITLLYVLVLTLLIGSITLLFPILINSAADLVKAFPGYLSKTQDWVLYQLRLYGVDQLAQSYGLDIDQLRIVQDQGQIGQLLVHIKESLTGLVGTLLGVTTGIMSVLIGLILSIYILKDKEKFSNGLRRVGLAWFGESQTEWYSEVFRESDRIFSGFISGKIIDSLIIGFVCYVGLSLMTVPYALLLTILIALFNLIPYFGIYIGTIPVAIITMFYDPVRAFWVAIFLLILQKVDAYILAPRILGDRVGLPPFWIIVSLIVGGEMFGIPGMILAVPTFAVIKRFFDAAVEKRLQEMEQS